ncbi:suppressor of fused-like protein [Apostichopus japonicus]|uniref:Suppressor of fused homolog n=1 Tax=Stichopus japonicus TaxID=307972 RepID=A0A2G8L5D3_STIJA|nr:suppressor of fused-like protein [Apostichopus japonicus]
METTDSQSGVVGTPLPGVPVGLEAVYASCRALYPNQPNPLQVTAVVKFWLGGPDPLDYISMYSNPGNPQESIPPHWHYISFGLSDLHGDGRVHERMNTNDGPSGFGFELSFRLKKEPTETAPPTWPAELMQGLARYVFQSENTLCSGDHVPWHASLDNSESRIQHMLMCEDPQLQTIQTPHGFVNFMQIVGVCSEELQAAQRWNGPGVLELLRSIPVAGGSWLITDMRRGESIFDINPQLQDEVENGIDNEGSNLSGVSAKCSWEEIDDMGEPSEPSSPRITKFESEQIKNALMMGLASEKTPLPSISRKDSDKSSSLDEELEHRRSSFQSEVESQSNFLELGTPRVINAVKLNINLEAGSLLPLALRGRLKHGRHFTFKSLNGDCAITLVSPRVEGAFVDTTHPFGARGPWMQILLTDDFVDVMAVDLECLNNPESMKGELPKHFQWPDRQFSLTVLPDD